LPIFQISEDLVKDIGGAILVKTIEPLVQKHILPGFEFNYTLNSADANGTNFGAHYHSIFGGVSMHANLAGDADVKAAFRGKYTIGEFYEDGEIQEEGPSIEDLAPLLRGPIYTGKTV